MNTKNLKAYAPKARSQFIEAVQKRAAHFGIYEDRIVEAKEEGSSILIEGRVFTKQQGQQRKRLAQRVEERGYDMFTREMAYTWFNRLAAIRYMEIHDYLEHGFRVLSNPNNAEGLPEILDHASDVADTLELDKSHIIELQLAGDKEEELYRELLLGQCHHLYKVMPFMFEEIDDATELLLPDNLTKTDSILKGLINEIPEEDWQSIEIIGWLYQFYISEHKDSVIGKVVKSEDIPAATQLFTPNWIVKYLVQNSVGRQWLATYPDSELKGKMEYYIEPAQQTNDVVEQLKAITPTTIDPEQIKVLDPAAGSGHILVEVYELLREIYLERGYRLREIPELILTKNIYGLDIDDRAAQLAGFALMMKAREDDRRIFQRVEDGEVELNVYSLQSTEGLDVAKLWKALNLEGNQKQGSTGGLFDGLDGEPGGFVQPTGIYKEYFELLQILKSAFLQAKTLGSLIQVDNEHLKSLVALKELLQVKKKGSDPSAKQATNDLLPIINQAISLANKYESVIANPPYMGFKYFTSALKEEIFSNFKEAKHDLFSAFVMKFYMSLVKGGNVSFMTPFTWMFLPSFKKFREFLLEDSYISSIVRPEYHSFFESAYVPICAFSATNITLDSYEATYIDLNDFYGAEIQSVKLKEGIADRSHSWVKEFSGNNIKSIPDMVFALDLNSNAIDIFSRERKVAEVAYPKQGIKTGDNEKFLRFWHEIDISKIEFNAQNDKEYNWPDNKHWCPIQKGGARRRWFGNHDYVVFWKNEGQLLKNFTDSKGKLRSRPQNLSFIHREGTTWTTLTVGDFSMRYSPKGFMSESAGSVCYADENIKYLLGLFNSKVMNYYMKAIAPTLSYSEGNVGKIPIIFDDVDFLENKVNIALELAKNDWDLAEESWDYKLHIMLNHKFRNLLLIECFQQTEKCLLEKKDSLREVEYEIDKHFIDTYDLGTELSPKVDEKQLTCRKVSQTSLLLSLLSYSLGCMMGRYSLDRDGLVYAHSGNEGFKELAAEGTYQTFPADDDGIIPLASEEWLFDDDATTLFKEFVKTVWGHEHLNENLEFVAESLCLHTLKPKKGEGAMDTLRRYFSTQFFKDHCKTYKKRPIYWLFSSGKEKAFECLVYLHRYNEGTLSRMRTEYVTPLMGKYEHMLNHLADKLVDATSSEKREIEKEQKSLTKKQAELRTFDEQLKHYAEMRISLDLDDGVKANYGKFGNLLADVKAIHGSAPKVVK